MSTTPHLRRLSRYLDDAMGASEALRFEAHLESCEDCRDALARLREASDALQAPLGDEAPAQQRTEDAVLRALRQDAPAPAKGLWWLGGAAAIAAACAALLWLPSTPLAPPERGRVLELGGTPTVAGAAVHPGLAIRADEAVSSGPKAGGYLVVEHDALARVYLEGDLTFTAEARQLRLDAGQVVVSMPPGAAKTQPYRVLTPAGAVRVTGTIFHVERLQGDAISVGVLRGSVRFEGTEPPIDIGAGQRWESGDPSPSPLLHAEAVYIAIAAGVEPPMPLATPDLAPVKRPHRHRKRRPKSKASPRAAKPPTPSPSPSATLTPTEIPLVAPTRKPEATLPAEYENYFRQAEDLEEDLKRR